MPTLDWQQGLNPTIRPTSWRVALALIWTCTGCAETQRIDAEAAEKQYLLGADLFEKGQLRPALEELLKALKFNPNSADVHYLLGLLSLREAADNESMVERQNCLKTDAARMEQEPIDAKFREAEASFRRAIELKPEFSEAWNGLAVVDLRFSRWDAAIASLLKALGNPLYRQPWTAQGNLGWAYYRKRDLPRAARELRQATFSNPQFCVGRYRLGKVQVEQGDLDAALEELERVTADPKCPIQEAFHLQGLLLLKRSPSQPGDRQRAAALFQRCVALAPRSCLAKECRIAD